MQKLANVYRKVAITQRFNFEGTKQSSQISMMEVKKATYGQAL